MLGVLEAAQVSQTGGGVKPTSEHSNIIHSLTPDGQQSQGRFCVSIAILVGGIIH